MRKHQVLSIAADLVEEFRGRPFFLGFMALSSIFFPFMMGLMDGNLSRAPIMSGADPRARVALVTQMLGPALAALMLGADTLFARKLKREMEPILAAPITDGELVAGWFLPVAAVIALYVPFGFAACELGYVVLGSSARLDLWADFVLFLLATVASTVWTVAFTLDGVFKARTSAAMNIRLLPAWIAVFVLDGFRFLLRFIGFPGAEIPTLILGVVLGLVAVVLVTRRLDREDLVQRI